MQAGTEGAGAPVSGSHSQTPAWTQERAELAAVLTSETFRRSSRVTQLLRYICERTFEGKDDELKEYTIAVEALGRPETFDHTRDSIVRVEAHRLRKRLERYYGGEGAGRPLRISLPRGGYVPKFQKVDSSPQRAGAARSGSRSSRWAWLASVAALLLVAAVYFVSYRAEQLSEGRSSVASDRVIRFSAGHNQWGAVDDLGRRWLGDLHAKGGELVTLPDREVRRSRFSAIHFRQRRGKFQYDIPLEPGFYEVSLYFAADEEAERNLFNVLGNGRPWLEAFDVLADAGGPNIQTVRTFAGVEPASDGHLHLDFQPLQGEALLSAIEITPSPSPQPLPIRLLAGRLAHMRDEAGNLWRADRFVEGGNVVLRRNEVQTDMPENIFGGERYGDFRYVIPVAPARYTLRLYFAETWFGESNHEEGGAGSRVFDVYLNGKPLLKNFDVFSRAGGENKAIVQEFRDVSPNVHSQLDLEFRSQPDANFAMVNAIEILPESAGAAKRGRR